MLSLSNSSSVSWISSLRLVLLIVLDTLCFSLLLGLAYWILRVLYHWYLFLVSNKLWGINLNLLIATNWHCSHPLCPSQLRILQTVLWVILSKLWMLRLLSLIGNRCWRINHPRLEITCWSIYVFCFCSGKSHWDISASLSEVVGYSVFERPVQNTILGPNYVIT